MEAARAGTAGKGFAVVADEVRRLAMQSSDAARVTAQLIKGMMQKADDGVMWQREVLQNLEEIVVQVHDVAAATGEIAAASERQQNGIGQLNLAVEQLNQVTQQTAANAEKTAGIAENSPPGGKDTTPGRNISTQREDHSNATNTTGTSGPC